MRLSDRIGKVYRKGRSRAQAQGQEQMKFFSDRVDDPTAEFGNIGKLGMKQNMDIPINGFFTCDALPGLIAEIMDEIDDQRKITRSGKEFGRQMACGHNPDPAGFHGGKGWHDLTKLRPDHRGLMGRMVQEKKPLRPFL